MKIDFKKLSRNNDEVLKIHHNSVIFTGTSAILYSEAGSKKPNENNAGMLNCQGNSAESNITGIEIG